MRVMSISPVRANYGYSQKNNVQKNNTGVNALKNTIPAADTVSFGMIKGEDADEVLQKALLKKDVCGAEQYKLIKDSTDFIAYMDKASGKVKGYFTKQFLESPLGKKHEPYMKTLEYCKTLEDLGDTENAIDVGDTLYDIEARRQGRNLADEMAAMCAEINAEKETEEECLWRRLSYLAN